MTESGETTTRLVGDAVVPCGADGSSSQGSILSGGAIDIDASGRIVAVGVEAELGPAPASVNRVGGLLMPGLVNTHAHTPMTLLRSVGDGLPLQRWLHEEVFPREAKMTADDAWWGMTLGSAEMLAAGVTTSCEMYWFEDAIVDATKASGARVLVSPAVISALLPNGDIDAWASNAVEFHRKWSNPSDLASNRVHVGFAPHALYTVLPEHCKVMAEAAVSVDALIHIHLEETSAERDDMMAKYGQSATKTLVEAGLFEAKVLAAHGVWLDEDDMAILAQAGASVAHCPQSNLKLGSGIAKIPDLMAAGVGVAVGTDGPASNDDLDLWDELKLAPMLARGSTHNPEAMSAATALDLATASAGDALGLPIGRLAPGAWADIIRVDIDQPAFSPGENLLAHLVFAGSSRFVTDVWVAGQPVVVAGDVVGVDVDKARAEVAERGARLSLDVQQS